MLVSCEVIVTFLTTIEYNYYSSYFGWQYRSLTLNGSEVIEKRKNASDDEWEEKKFIWKF